MNAVAPQVIRTEVPRCNLRYLTEKAAYLNKRAAKIGVAGIDLEIGSDVFYRDVEVLVWDDSRGPFTETISVAHVTAELTIRDEIRIDGWKMIARLDHEESLDGQRTMTVIRTIADQDVPDELSRRRERLRSLRIRPEPEVHVHPYPRGGVDPDPRERALVPVHVPRALGNRERFRRRVS